LVALEPNVADFNHILGGVYGFAGQYQNAFR
jgi:hypothetical protein